MLQRQSDGVQAGPGHLHIGYLQEVPLRHLGGHFGDCEQADHDSHDVKPIQQVVRPEGEAKTGRKRVGSDRGDEQTEATRQKALDDRASRNDRDGEKPHYRQHGIFGRCEVCSKTR